MKMSGLKVFFIVFVVNYNEKKKQAKLVDPRHLKVEDAE